MYFNKKRQLQYKQFISLKYSAFLWISNFINCLLYFVFTSCSAAAVLLFVKFIFLLVLHKNLVEVIAVYKITWNLCEMISCTWTVVIYSNFCGKVIVCFIAFLDKRRVRKINKRKIWKRIDKQNQKWYVHRRKVNKRLLNSVFFINDYWIFLNQ